METQHGKKENSLNTNQGKMNKHEGLCCNMFQIRCVFINFHLLKSMVFLSEIRLMEILEGLCDSSSFECNHMVEEHEEHFETWWFKRSGPQMENLCCE